MKIELDDDCVDTIIQNALVEDYVSLTSNLKHPDSFHEEDLAAFKSTSEAIKVLGNWYFAWGEFDKAVKKARKAK